MTGPLPILPGLSRKAGSEETSMSEKKVVMFAFKGDPLCFVHVLLNGLDLNEKGLQGKIVLEGESVTLVEKMSQAGHFLNPLYQKALTADLFLGACKACSTKLNAREAIEIAGIPLIGDMAGHPSFASFLADGWEILTL